jgi:sugar/nucleoside kinase (ribokinase family)
MREAKRRGMSVSFDPNSDLSGALGAEARRLLPLLDLLFLNEMEALSFTRARSPSKALAALSKLVPCAVVKLGAKGAIAASGGACLRQAGFRVRSLDTTGAGDSFAAGFVAAFLGGADLGTCLRWANGCGALSTRGVGGTPAQPTRPELERLLRGKSKRGKAP